MGAGGVVQKRKRLPNLKNVPNLSNVGQRSRANVVENASEEQGGVRQSQPEPTTIRAPAWWSCTTYGKDLAESLATEKIVDEHSRQ